MGLLVEPVLVRAEGEKSTGISVEATPVLPEVLEGNPLVGGRRIAFDQPVIGREGMENPGLSVVTGFILDDFMVEIVCRAAQDIARHVDIRLLRQGQPPENV